jgi:hypothetical protein
MTHSDDNKERLGDSAPGDDEGQLLPSIAGLHTGPNFCLGADRHVVLGGFHAHSVGPRHPDRAMRSGDRANGHSSGIFSST